MDGGAEEIKDADIIIVKLESQVKITDDVYGDSTLGWLLSPEENGWGGLSLQCHADIGIFLRLAEDALR